MVKELYSMSLICHTVLNGQFYSQFENKDTNFHMEGVSDLSYELCYCVENEVHQIQTQYGILVH